MKVSDFDYELPPERIAQHPADRRDRARLMVLHRGLPGAGHRRVSDLPALLREGDLLVLNNTRVFPARLQARKPTGGAVEVFLLEEVAEEEWAVLLRASRRPRVGECFTLEDGRATVEVVEVGEQGRAKVRFESPEPVLALAERLGRPPLPPYIKRPAGAAHDPEDRERYQTVYAEEVGAVAAPTAGLHFTDVLLDALASRGVRTTKLTLHVGPGTFRPVTAERINEHEMEAERYVVPEAAAAAVEETRATGGRVVAVGSTSVRTLETVACGGGLIEPGQGRSSLFIHPPYTFKVVDGMMTNFHLPRSTLIMMVCAFAGYEATMAAYREAVEEGYRFYSYGDAMLVLP